MTWLEAVPTGLLTLAVFFIPGSAILLASRLPWFIAVSVAPPVSVAVAAVGAIFAERFGVAWGLLPFAVGTAAFVIVAAVAARLIRPPRRDVVLPRAVAIWALIGVGVAAPIAIIPFAIGIGAADTPPQTWDAVFHLNALQYITDTGNASTLTLGTVSAPGRSAAFYPAGWHDILSTTIGTLPVPLSANLGSLAILGFIWPIGLALLAAVVFPAHPVAAFVAPIVGSFFAAFPARMLAYGTLWPTALSTALLPAVIAVVVLLLSRGLAPRSRLRLVLALVLALVGAAFAHPTAAFAFVALSAPYALWRGGTVLARWWSAGQRTRAIVVPTVVTVSLAVASVLLLRAPALSGVLNYPRPQLSTHGQAIGEALFDSMVGATGYGSPDAFWLLGVATIAGFVLLAVRREGRWLCVSYSISVALYALAMGPDGVLRNLAGPWYKDPVRLGGLVPLFGTLLAAYAVVAIGSYLAGSVVDRRESLSPRRGALRAIAPAAANVALIVMLLSVTGAGGSERRWIESARHYGIAEGVGGYLLTAGERRMMDRIDGEVPADQTVLGNPFNGSAYVYALADREVVFRHVSGSWDADRLYLGQHFDEINTDPKVCDLLRTLDVGYFYDDPDLYAGASPWQERYVGLTASGVSSGLEIVDQGDSATLYRITACDTE